MLNVLLVKIQPNDVVAYSRPDDFKFFNDKTLDFDISVLNGEPLQFKASKEYYLGPNRSNAPFDQKVNAISEELGVKYGGQVVAIDKYPRSQFRGGVEIDPEKWSGRTSYKIDCQSGTSDYHSIILLVPGREAIILSDLKFACYEDRGFCPSFITFNKEAVLSLKSPFGEVIGIALKRCNKSALEPDSNTLEYTMSFEKVSLPAVVLQKLLETKPQADTHSDIPDAV